MAFIVALITSPGGGIGQYIGGKVNNPFDYLNHKVMFFIERSENNSQISFQIVPCPDSRHLKVNALMTLFIDGLLIHQVLATFMLY